ncbi:MAG: hypothetical protein AMXMBFR20_15160 [Planctomycetia bacterium]
MKTMTPKTSPATPITMRQIEPGAAWYSIRRMHRPTIMLEPSQARMTHLS